MPSAMTTMHFLVVYLKSTRECHRKLIKKPTTHLMRTIRVKTRKLFLEYGAIITLAVLLAFNYQLFIVNNGFAPAGLNGIATIIQYKTSFSIGYMSRIINVPLCVAAYSFHKQKIRSKITLLLSCIFVFFFTAAKVGA